MAQTFASLDHKKFPPEDIFIIYIILVKLDERESSSSRVSNLSLHVDFIFSSLLTVTLVLKHLPVSDRFES